MLNRKNQIPVILLIILLSLFALHLSQYKFSWSKLKPLDGYYVDAEAADFSWKDWFAASYQEKEDKYLNDHFGFRNFFIRLNHQWRFSLFEKAKTQWGVVGKKIYLYEESYIDAWYGNDFIGHDSIEHRMRKFKMLQDTLNTFGKKIIILLAPGKGSFYPEFIPDKFHKAIENTNIGVYRDYIEKYRINCLDFNQYFIDNKYKSPYPLYPQYDIHWSYYGMCLVLDSIVRYMEMSNNIEMPHVYWEKIRMGQPPEEYDCGSARAMNLLFKPRTFKMAYPVLLFESDEGKTKPSLLTVSDSFFWGIFGMGLGSLFIEHPFWYYNQEIYPPHFSSPWTTKDINLHDEILKFDFIIILCTDANLPNLGWGFIENSYDVFFKD
jgi:hypothetical protein